MELPQGDARKAYILEVLTLLVLENDLYPQKLGVKETARKAVSRLIQYNTQERMESRTEHYILKYISKR